MIRKPPVLALIIILFSFLLAQAQQGPTSWQRYTVPKQEFSVTLPTLPAMSYYPPHDGSRWRILLGAYAEGVVYTVSIYENQRNKQSLADFITEQTAEWRPEPATQKEIIVNGVTGREYLFSPPNKVLFFGNRERFYSFRVLGAESGDPKPQQFLSSIHFGAKEEGIAVSDGPGIPYQQDADQVPYVGKDVTRKARLGFRPEPMYTQEARHNQVTGTVVLKVVFSSEGNVTNIRIVSRLPCGLTEQAIDAAKKIKFIPAMKDGHYVSMWMQLEYNFNLY